MLSKQVIDGKVLMTPEKRFTSDNKAVLNFKFIHAEKMDINVIVYGKQAEELDIKNGDYLVLEGNLETEKNNDKTLLILNAKNVTN